MATNGTIHDYATGLGFSVGWQFLLAGRIIIDLGLGIGYGYWVTVDVNGATTSGFSFVPFNSLLPPELHLGFRF